MMPIKTYSPLVTECTSRLRDAEILERKNGVYTLDYVTPSGRAWDITL